MKTFILILSIALNGFLIFATAFIIYCANQSDLAKRSYMADSNYWKTKFTQLANDRHP
jgi:hypothetical protein